MPKFLVSCAWQVVGTMIIEAENADVALWKAHDCKELPEGGYVQGTFDAAYATELPNA